MASDPDRPWLDADVKAYCEAHTTPPDANQRALIDETASLPNALMQIAFDQGVLMEIVVRAMGARTAVEVGTFTGYSALAIARALPDDGRVICCDVSETWTAIARRHWDEAGVAHKIDLRIGPATDTLEALPDGEWLDVGFIDADKTSYATYYEQLLGRLRQGGVLFIDNTLWYRRVLDEPDRDDDTRAIVALNDVIAADDRVTTVLLPISDGLTIVQKR